MFIMLNYIFLHTYKKEIFIIILVSSIVITKTNPSFNLEKSNLYVTTIYNQLIKLQQLFESNHECRCWIFLNIRRDSPYEHSLRQMTRCLAGP